MWAKLPVLLEITFLPILGRRSEAHRKPDIFLSIYFVSTFFWGSHGVELWIWEEIKGEKKK